MMFSSQVEDEELQKVNQVEFQTLEQKLAAAGVKE